MSFVNVASIRRRGAQIRLLLGGIPFFFTRRIPRSPSHTLRLRFVYLNFGAPTRYRVQHQMEQAQLADLSVQDAPLDGPRNPYDLTACDLLYIYRLPLTLRTLPLLIAARQRRIPIVFDSDDLVWDRSERYYNYLDDHYAPREVARILRTTRRTRALMRWADVLVFSTPYLAQRAAQSFTQPIYVNTNAISQIMMMDAESARKKRLAHGGNERVVIGYFSGHPHVHDEDLHSIAQALATVFTRHPTVDLRIYGELKLMGELATPAYAARIEQRPSVDWRELPYHIAQVDINIAPLVDNPQRRSKSAVKYMEAAILGVPTIASSLEPYQDHITNDVTGLLATTPDDWSNGLSRLAQSAELRHRLGEAARTHVLTQHTTAARAATFAQTITQVVS